VAQARVTSFSLMKPSLHDIFMRIAGPAAEEATMRMHKILTIARRDT